MVTLTEAAVSKVKEMRAEHQAEGSGLRVMVVGGGCSGLSYDMDFEREEREGDLVVECDGLRVFVDPMSLNYLEGTQIDYVVQFTHSGFLFENPNAARSCGCGSSFSV
jgi:iron-sulfur cluster assembly accessory protein